jgi:Protein of unknown function (DUF2877)
MILDVAADVLSVVRAGVLAREFCRQSTRAEVAAVFERSLYLRAEDMFICLGEPSIGNGPLTLIADFSSSRLQRRQPASISEQGIAIGDTARFSFDRCEPWQPPRWPHSLSPLQLIDVGQAIAGRMAAEAPVEGLGGLYCGSETSLTRIARPRITRFEAWLCNAFETDRVSSGAVHNLIGLGPGLTPSGDDFLAGALALVDALAETKAHAALARAINASPHGLTSPLSGCLLRVAAAGHVGENLHRAIAALISGDVDAAIASIRNIGHSSGWDMLAGATTALQVVATVRSPGSRRRPSRWCR